MENTVYIYPALSLQHASKIFKIGILTKNPLGYFSFVSTRRCVRCTVESFWADNMKRCSCK